MLVVFVCLFVCLLGVTANKIEALYDSCLQVLSVV
jgi:hypothetical protein